jgi:hypothetical protein
MIPQKEIDTCPFCNAKAYLDGRSDDVCVRCTECKSAGRMAFFDSENDEEIAAAEIEAINHWNRRVREGFQVKALQDAKDAFEVLRPCCKDGADFADVIDSTLPIIKEALTPRLPHNGDLIWISFKEGVVWNIGMEYNDVFTNAEIVRLYRHVQTVFTKDEVSNNDLKI